MSSAVDSLGVHINMDQHWIPKVFEGVFRRKWFVFILSAPTEKLRTG